MGSLISDVGGLFGAGSNNAGFTAQQAQPIQPITQGQVQNAQGQALQGVGQAQGLGGLLGGQAYQGASTQDQLTQALSNLSQGIGPNPAQAALAQQTQQNIANQAALQAGQRGAGANVGLMARQIGQQGANTQQQAIGQGATLQAQQQLGALGQLQGLAGSQVNQGLGGVGLSNQAALGNQGQLLGALQGYNSANIQNASQANSANQAMASQNAKSSQGILGGIANAAGGILGGVANAAGGLLRLADGGQVPTESILAQAMLKKQFPDHLKAIADIYHPKVLQKMACGGMAKGAVVPGEPKHPGKNTESNDKVPAMLTPKEIVLPLSVTQSENPGEAAKAFVEKIKGKSDFKDALKKHMANRKSKA